MHLLSIPCAKFQFSTHNLSLNFSSSLESAHDLTITTANRIENSVSKTAKINPFSTFIGGGLYSLFMTFCLKSPDAVQHRVRFPLLHPEDQRQKLLTCVPCLPP